MNLLGQPLVHKKYGNGRILAQDAKTVTVQFAAATKKFVYPDAFNNFLKLENPSAAHSLAEEIAHAGEERKSENPVVSAAVIQQSKGMERDANPNIVFKCTYCNGGASKDSIGFHGICSNANIRYNIETAQKTWCSAKRCPCCKYLEGKISRRQLEEEFRKTGFVCYESKMLRDWEAFAGFVVRGARAGQPIHLRQVQANSLCVLTTRYPGTKEAERKIFAVFLIDEAYSGGAKDEGFVTADPKYRLALTPKQAEKMPFWRYYENEKSSGKIFWGTGLYRYLDNVRAAQILRDIVILKENTNEQALAQELLQKFCVNADIDPAALPEPGGILMNTV